METLHREKEKEKEKEKEMEMEMELLTREIDAWNSLLKNKFDAWNPTLRNSKAAATALGIVDTYMLAKNRPGISTTMEIDHGGVAAYKEEGIVLGIKEEHEEEGVDIRIKEEEEHEEVGVDMGIKEEGGVDLGIKEEEEEGVNMGVEEKVEWVVMGKGKGKKGKQKGKKKGKKKTQQELQTEWEEKVVKVLQIARWHQHHELDPKKGFHVPTRCCFQNIALFDLNKESKAGLGPPVSSVSSSNFFELNLDDSVNVTSIKIVQSDVAYPISIFGTVLARDQVDYRCVYLYRRGRNNPQVIMSSEDSVLTLTGPNRALGTKDFIFFEIDLKIIINEGKEDVVKDFSKGVLVHNNVCGMGESKTLTLESWLSTLHFVYTLVPIALEATIAVNVQVNEKQSLQGKQVNEKRKQVNEKGKLSTFSGIVSASTSENMENTIVLYDDEVKGTPTALGDGGSIQLTRCLVAVPFDEKLVINVAVYNDEPTAEFFQLFLGHNDVKFTRRQGSYKVQVKVIWTCRSWRRENMRGKIGSIPVLL